MKYSKIIRQDFQSDVWLYEILVYPREPYDFNESALIFTGGDPVIRTFDGNELVLTVSVQDIPVHLKIRSSGSVSSPSLSLTITSISSISSEVLSQIEDLIKNILSLDDNLTLMYDEFKEDRELMTLFNNCYGLKSPKTPTVFEALVDSIIEQQISLSVAYQLEHRLIKETGSSLTLDNEIYYCYPTRQQLANTSIEVFRKCGLTQRKSEYIRDVSNLIASGKLDLESMQDIPETEKIIEKLCSIRGIGRWTAELTMIRGFHRPDAFPAADIALRRMIGNRFFNGKKISEQEARTFAENWGSWKGLISFYLEVSEKKENLKKRSNITQ
ncbi:DNA-3-methyladenine glycosylase family protein [Methanospirillum lacunae]|uniref:DNA-3-methyladenine glycosylase 2 family protein n=1 Tax=Methanospirillum lacunae TaxID=668570 RepID=A0A2V2N1R1_9EURY|nr:DNA-3-methyladenine glycosylase [Methanospirillum lacunae]PWR74274.1 DNA-3-methyladenine glycosylase 2 family protein [Methanospirillum lacunae]